METQFRGGENPGLDHYAPLHPRGAAVDAAGVLVAERGVENGANRHAFLPRTGRGDDDAHVAQRGVAVLERDDLRRVAEDAPDGPAVIKQIRWRIV